TGPFDHSLAAAAQLGFGHDMASRQATRQTPVQDYQARSARDGKAGRQARVPSRLVQASQHPVAKGTGLSPAGLPLDDRGHGMQMLRQRKRLRPTQEQW